MKPHILAGVSLGVAEYTVTGWLVKFERSAVVGLVTQREHLPLRLCPSSIGESLRSLFTGFFGGNLKILWDKSVFSHPDMVELH